MALQNLQVEFAEAITLAAHVPGIRPAEHFVIYQNNYMATLTRVLADLYPLIVKLVGDDFFSYTAKEYIKLYPARTPTLNDYGEYFSHFLAHFQPVKDLVYLSEVAKFEWICHVIYYASEHEKLDKTMLEKIPAEKYDQLHLILNPASQVIKFYFPILQIIELCEKNSNESVALEEEGINLLIIRRSLEIFLVPLSEAEFVFLQALGSGKVLKDALQDALTVNSNFNLQDKLINWVEDQTIVGFKVA